MGSLLNIPNVTSQTDLSGRKIFDFGPSHFRELKRLDRRFNYRLIHFYWEKCENWKLEKYIE